MPELYKIKAEIGGQGYLRDRAVEIVEATGNIVKVTLNKPFNNTENGRWTFRLQDLEVWNQEQEESYSPLTHYDVEYWFHVLNQWLTFASNMSKKDAQALVDKTEGQKLRIVRITRTVLRGSYKEPSK